MKTSNTYLQRAAELLRDLETETDIEVRARRILSWRYMRILHVLSKRLTDEQIAALDMNPGDVRFALGGAIKELRLQFK